MTNRNRIQPPEPLPSFPWRNLGKVVLSVLVVGIVTAAATESIGITGEAAFGMGSVIGSLWTLYAIVLWPLD